MSIIKNIISVVASLVILLLIIALFITNDFNYNKSIVINAPIDKVWQHVDSLADLDQWSPWNDLDPNMTKTITGEDGKVGAKNSWYSDVKDVGNGSQTITKIEAPTLLETELKFYGDYESEGAGYIKLTEQNGKTLVTWGFTSEIPYPFNLMNLFFDPEYFLGKNFSNGLTKLKVLAEKN